MTKGMKEIYNRLTQTQKRMSLSILAIVLLIVISGLVDRESQSNETTTFTDEQVAVEEEKDLTEEVVTPVEVEVSEEEEEVETEELAEKVEEVEEIYDGPVSFLTGLPTDEETANTRPIGVMISNIYAALPQYGTSDAAIIYETLVEGGITRMFAVFDDFDAEKIGSIRSSRHYYLDFALNHDAVYVHFGQSSYAIEAFKVLDVDRIYGISYMENYFSFKDPDRKAPHSTFTSADLLASTMETLGYRTSRQEDFKGFRFTDLSLMGDNSDVDYRLNEIEGAQVADKISMDYSSAYRTNPYFIYDEEEGIYYRYEFEDPQMDALTETQLSFENIIIQLTSIWRIKTDPYGCMDMTLIGEGRGYFINDGVAMPITWSKDDHYSPTVYTYADGSEIQLDPGKTFISVFPEYNEDTIIFEDTSLEEVVSSETVEAESIED